MDERHEIVADLRRGLATQHLRELRANERGGVIGVERSSGDSSKSAMRSIPIPPPGVACGR